MSREIRAIAEREIDTVFQWNQTYCQGAGSLHQVALDMIGHSSPHGSHSYSTFHHVLQKNPFFYVNMGDGFEENENNVVAMLKGFALERAHNWTTEDSDMTLVDVASRTSLCPIDLDHCFNQTRNIIQSEQLDSWYWTPRLIPRFKRCHLSPDCIIIEYSDSNYRILEARGFKGSVVLLPVMTQAISQLGSPTVDGLKHLQNRSLDIVFYATKKKRRRPILKAINTYAEKVGHWKSEIGKTEKNFSRLADSYANSKICLVVHSYGEDAALEYHRLSDFAPFGCVPVMERPADTLFVEAYRRCGRVIFFKRFPNCGNYASSPGKNQR